MSEIISATISDAGDGLPVTETDQARLDAVAHVLTTNEELTQQARLYAHHVAERLREHYGDYLSSDALARLQPAHVGTHVFVADSRNKLDQAYAILLGPDAARDTSHDGELILGEYHAALGGVIVALATDDVIQSPGTYTKSEAAGMYTSNTRLYRSGETEGIAQRAATRLLFDTVAEETTHMVQDPLLPVAVREVLVNYHVSVALAAEERIPTAREERCRSYCEELNAQLAGVGIPDILERLAFGAALPPYVRAYVIRQIMQQAPVLLDS